MLSGSWTDATHEKLSMKLRVILVFSSWHMLDPPPSNSCKWRFIWSPYQKGNVFLATGILGGGVVPLQYDVTCFPNVLYWFPILSWECFWPESTTIMHYSLTTQPEQVDIDHPPPWAQHNFHTYSGEEVRPSTLEIHDGDPILLMVQKSGRENFTFRTSCFFHMVSCIQTSRWWNFDDSFEISPQKLGKLFPTFDLRVFSDGWHKTHQLVGSYFFHQQYLDTYCFYVCIHAVCIIHTCSLHYTYYL